MKGETIILNSWPISTCFSVEAVLHDQSGWDSTYLTSDIYRCLSLGVLRYRSVLKLVIISVKSGSLAKRSDPVTIQTKGKVTAEDPPFADIREAT